MKVVVAGSREITDYKAVCDAIQESGFEITELVSGHARGVDILGEQWAKERNIPVKQFPADWKRFGRSGGIVRNKEMCDYADALVAVWNGSPGTKHCIEYAKSKNMKVYVKRV